MNGRSNQNARQPKEEWSKWEGSRFRPDLQSGHPGARSAARRYARAVAGVVAGHCLPLVRSAQTRQPESGAGTHPALLALACEGPLLQLTGSLGTCARCDAARRRVEAVDGGLGRYALDRHLQCGVRLAANRLPAQLSHPHHGRRVRSEKPRANRRGGHPLVAGGPARSCELWRIADAAGSPIRNSCETGVDRRTSRRHLNDGSAIATSGKGLPARFPRPGRQQAVGRAELAGSLLRRGETEPALLNRATLARDQSQHTTQKIQHGKFLEPLYFTVTPYLLLPRPELIFKRNG